MHILAQSIRMQNLQNKDFLKINFLNFFIFVIDVYIKIKMLEIEKQIPKIIEEIIKISCSDAFVDIL